MLSPSSASSPSIRSLSTRFFGQPRLTNATERTPSVLVFAPFWAIPAPKISDLEAYPLSPTKYNDGRELGFIIAWLLEMAVGQRCAASGPRWSGAQGYTCALC